MAINRKKVFISLLMFLLGFLNSNIIAQSIEKKSIIFNSLEEEPVRVNIELDYVGDKIKIIFNPSQTICIDGFRGLAEDIKIISKKFVTLTYKMRAGSGVKVRRTVLICVSKGYLYRTLDIGSLDSYEFKNTYDKETDSRNLYDESGIYKISFINPKNTKNNEYLLEATQYEKIKSKHDPSKNHETLDTLRFNFDNKNKVFYTEYRSLKGNYIFAGKQRVFMGEKYPIIKLINDEYLFIDKIWYSKVRENNFAEVSPACN
ncbi:MAG TPA: hypothetical protein VFN30_15600 [Chitinophagaceae bacterium]|nr:hypothetical protein [Chitinophagaceae bacterium]